MPPQMSVKALLSMTLAHIQCHHFLQAQHRSVVESCPAPLVVSQGVPLLSPWTLSMN